VGESNLKSRLLEMIEGMTEEQQIELLKLLDWQYKIKRSHSRMPCSIVVDYSTGSVSHRDFILNISAGGAFIETQQPVSVGREITLSFLLFSRENPIRITGKIVRASRNGFAVQFSRTIEDLDKQVRT